MRLINFIFILALLFVFVGCSSTEDDELSAEIERRNWELAKYSMAEIAQWRADVMPNLLLEFKYDDPIKWRDAKAVLYNDVRVPEHIYQMIKADDALTVEGRDKLVKEGMIYNLLATFNSDSREEWHNAVSVLTNLSEDAKIRCIGELIRRMQAVMNVKSIDSDKIKTTASGNMDNIAEQLNQSFKDYNEQLNLALMRATDLSTKSAKLVQKAFWASQELSNIGEPAIPYLLMISKSFISGFVNEMLLNTLSNMGEMAVPALIDDLKQSKKLPTAEIIFAHKRFLIKCIGNIYFNMNYSFELTDEGIRALRKHVRDDLQYNHQATKAITIQLRDYLPYSDSTEFQFRIECILSLRKIGDKSACVPLVELWERLLEEDEDLEMQIKIALLDLSGRKLNTREQWEKYADMLTDPEDID